MPYAFSNSSFSSGCTWNAGGLFTWLLCETDRNFRHLHYVQMEVWHLRLNMVGRSATCSKHSVPKRSEMVVLFDLGRPEYVQESKIVRPSKSAHIVSCDVFGGKPPVDLHRFWISGGWLFQATLQDAQATSAIDFSSKLEDSGSTEEKSRRIEESLPIHQDTLMADMILGQPVYEYWILYLKYHRPALYCRISWFVVLGLAAKAPSGSIWMELWDGLQKTSSSHQVSPFRHLKGQFIVTAK